MPSRNVKSPIPLNYTTVKTTKSRIAKGLLAIPVSLVDLFPKDKGQILLINENGQSERKKFTAYSRSTKECRIGGLAAFYTQYSVEDGDELVIQKINEDTFRLLPESIFRKKYLSSLSLFEESDDEETAQKTLNEVKEIANISVDTILLNAFIQLSNESIIQQRKTAEVKQQARRESVPLALRKILLSIYDGKCQITNFTFLTKSGSPYFEIHHIDPLTGNHPKNLLVVCPNVHAQFTHADIEQTFDGEGWLRSVKFNGEFYTVLQKIDKLRQTFEKEIHSI